MLCRLGRVFLPDLRSSPCCCRRCLKEDEEGLLTGVAELAFPPRSEDWDFLLALPFLPFVLWRCCGSVLGLSSCK